MPDNQTVITEKKEEEKKELPIGQEVREKSFTQLLKENQVERAKPTKEEDSAPTHTPELDAKAKEDERLAKEAEDAKAKIEADEADKKRVADLAATAAAEVIKKQEEAKQAKFDAEAKEAKDKEREESLKPRFTGKDEKGNVVPKSYEEIAEEATRIAEEKAYARLQNDLAVREARQKEEEAIKTQSEEARKAQEKAYADQLQKELDTDLNDLYLANKLPKIVNKDDPNDSGNKEFRNLFETAQKVNGERMANGEPPIRSIKLIYYEHYKPLTQPAGHNAPVMGAESSISHEAPEDQYIPSRDRNKSMKQLLKEEAVRLSRKIGVRGA